MSNLFKILGYISIALAIFIGGWQLSDWYKGDVIHIKEVVKNDTLYIVKSMPKIIEKPIYIDKIIHRIDTVHTTKIIERTVEYAVHDTVYFQTIPERMVLSGLIRDSSFASISYQDLRIPQTIVSAEKREWWEDLIYLTGTALVTYGVTQIK